MLFVDIRKCFFKPFSSPLGGFIEINLCQGFRKHVCLFFSQTKSTREALQIIVRGFQFIQELFEAVSRGSNT